MGQGNRDSQDCMQHGILTSGRSATTLMPGLGETRMDCMHGLGGDGITCRG